MKIRDIPIIGRAKNPDDKSGVITRPVLSVIRCEAGPHRGEFAVVAHGKAPDGRMTVLEIATYKTFEYARAVYEVLRRGLITVDDVPNFEVTPKLLQAVEETYEAARKACNA
jgi:hypothetical protein